MSSIASIPIFVPKTEPLEGSIKQAAALDPSIKLIDNPARIERARQLLYTDTMQEYVYDRVLQLPNPAVDKQNETIAVPLKFSFNVGSLLDDCTAALEKNGFHVKERVFKGGAIHFLLDGYPATLRDFDVGLVIDQPEDPNDWQKIHNIILKCLEEKASLKSFRYLNDPMITYTNSSKKISIEMPIVDGKKSLFEYGGLETMWGWWHYPKLLELGEEYALYAIPAKPYRVELEVVASHVNSATCSLDSLRFHYNEHDDKFSCWMTAVDGYDVHKALSLRRKGFFYCIKERIPTLREGIYRYCSHLLKGYLPVELADEEAFCEAFFNNKEELERFSLTLPKFLKNHTSCPQDRIRYLLNLDAIFHRYGGVSDDKKSPLRRFIGQLLFLELGVEKFGQKAEDLISEMQLMRDYIYLLTSPESRTPHFYGPREFCRINDPKDREQGYFIIESPTAESLKRLLSDSVNGITSLEKLCNYFPHGQKDVRSFFCEKLERPQKEKEEKREPAPPSFKNFNDFAGYYQARSDLPLKKCAKYLQDLFSFKKGTLAEISPEAKSAVKKALSTIKDLLKKEKSLITTVFNEAFTTNIYSQAEIDSLVIEIVQSLLTSYSQEDFKDAMDFALRNIAKISPKDQRSLLDILLKTPIGPKPIVELLSNIKFDLTNSGEQIQLFEVFMTKIREKAEFHSCLMTFWKNLNKSLPKESASLEKAIAIFTSSTIEILIKSQDEKVLYWADEIASATKHPQLFCAKSACENFVTRGVSEVGQKVIYFYMQKEHELLKPEGKERFASCFPAFMEALLKNAKYTEAELSTAKRGLAHVKTISEDFVKTIVSRFKGVKIPGSLRKAFDEFKKLVKPVKVTEKEKPLAPKVTQKETSDKKEDHVEVKEKPQNGIPINSPEIRMDVEPPKKSKSDEPNQFSPLEKRCETIWELGNGAGTKVLQEQMIASFIAKNEQLLLKNPSGTEQIWSELFIAYHVKKDHKNILRCGDTLVLFLKNKADRAYVFRCTGIASFDLGQLERAIHNFEVALHNSPTNERAIGWLSKCYFYNRQWAEALKIINLYTISALGKNSVETSKYEHVAKLCIKSKYVEAIKEIEKEWDLNAKKIAFHKWCLLSWLYEQVDKKLLAVGCLQEALAFSPENPEALLKSGDLLKNIDRDAAIGFYNRVVKADSESVLMTQATISLGSLYLHKREWHTSICCYASACAQNLICFEKDELAQINFHCAIIRFIESIRRKTAEPKKINGVKNSLSVAAKSSKNRQLYLSLLKLTTEVEKLSTDLPVAQQEGMDKAIAKILLKIATEYSRLSSKHPGIEDVDCMAAQSYKAHTEYEQEFLGKPSPASNSNDLDKDKIPVFSKSKQGKELPILATTLLKDKKVRAAQIYDLLMDREAALSKNPEGNDQLWAELVSLCFLKTENDVSVFDPENDRKIIKYGEKLIPTLTDTQELETLQGNIGTACLSLGRIEKALAYLERAYEINNDQTTLAGLIAACVYAERWSEALDYYKRLTPSTNFVGSEKYRDIALNCQNKNFNKALALLESFNESSYAISRLYLMGVLHKRNGYGKARTCFRSVLALVPNHSKTLKQLTEKSSDTPPTEIGIPQSLPKSSSEETQSKSIPLSPLQASKSSIQSLERSASSEAEKSTFLKKIIDENEEVLLKNPLGSEETWSNLFNAYLCKQDHKNIIRCGDKLLIYHKLSKQDARIVNRTMANSWEAVGDLENAYIYAKEALKIEPNCTVSLMMLIKSSFFNKRWAEAIEKIKEFKSKSQGEDPSLDKSQEVAELCAAGKFDKAIELIKTWPDHDELVYKSYLLGLLYEDLNNKPEAIKNFEATLRNFPENPKILLKLAKLCEDDRRIDYFQRVLKADSNPAQLGQANMSLGLLYLNKEEWHSAICRYAATYAANPSVFEREPHPVGKSSFHFVLLRFVESVRNKKAKPEHIKMVKVTLSSLLAKKSSSQNSEFKKLFDLMSELLIKTEILVKKFTEVDQCAIEVVICAEYLKLAKQFAQLNAKDLANACMKTYEEYKNEISRKFTSD